VTVRTELLGHRDGAEAFSGTTLTDPEVVRRQEITTPVYRRGRAVAELCGADPLTGRIE
jgi:hypothetical protein